MNNHAPCCRRGTTTPRWGRLRLSARTWATPFFRHRPDSIEGAAHTVHAVRHVAQRQRGAHMKYGHTNRCFKVGSGH